MIEFHFYNPTRIIFGSGKLATLHEQSLSGKNALLLISNGKSTQKNGSLERVKAELKKAGVIYSVFDKIMENPVREVIMEAQRLRGKITAILFLRSAARCSTVRPR